MTDPKNAALSIPRLAGMCLMAFMVLMSYAFARPSIESLFVEAHGSKSLPTVWVMVAAVATVTVVIYNRLSTGAGLLKIFGGVIGTTLAALAVILGLRHLGVPGATYALYIWKELYIVFLVEIFWTFANGIYHVKEARWLYGLFLIMGSLGGVTGNLAVGAVARDLGTEAAVWLVFPALLASWGLSLLVGRGLEAADTAPTPAPAPDAAQTSARDKLARFGEGFRVITGSRYMILLLLLIMVTQVAITLVDYQYNVTLEATYPNMDLRTEIGGQVYAAIDISALALQLLSGPILSFLGVSRTLLGIPVMLGTAVGAFLVAPRFVTMAVAKVASKAFDYSLFRAAKEILYIPLSRAEKTQGKAVVDILVYRVTKGGVSGLLAALLALEIAGLVMTLTMGVLAMWIGVTWALINEHRRRTSAEGASEEGPAAAETTGDLGA